MNKSTRAATEGAMRSSPQARARTTNATWFDRTRRVPRAGVALPWLSADSNVHYGTQHRHKLELNKCS